MLGVSKYSVEMAERRRQLADGLRDLNRKSLTCSFKLPWFG
jgi:hypothetical protein